MLSRRRKISEPSCPATSPIWRSGSASIGLIFCMSTRFCGYSHPVNQRGRHLLERRYARRFAVMGSRRIRRWGDLGAAGSGGGSGVRGDVHAARIGGVGRKGWQKTAGYNPRAGAEGAMNRYKRIIGDTLHSHTRPAGRPRRSKPGSPSPSSTKCLTSDARTPSAPPDDQRTRVKSVLIGLHSTEHSVRVFIVTPEIVC